MENKHFCLGREDIFAAKNTDFSICALTVSLRLAQSRGFVLFVPVSSLILLDCESAAVLSERSMTISTFFILTSLFSNTKVFEDDIQDLLCPDPSSDSSQAGESQPDTLSCQSEVRVPVSLILCKGCHTLLKVGPVASLGQGGGTRERITTPREDV